MTDETALWDAYNLLLLGSDTERIRKLLVRYDLFRRTLTIPGDIVECGVLKGASLLYFLKLLHIYAPGSNKKVIGFDMFDSFPVQDDTDAEQVQRFVEETNFRGITPESLYEKIEQAGFSHSQCELVAGDIQQTAYQYLEERPGLRISLLHLDLDLEAGTYVALDAFWERIVPGGIIIFDEYAVHQWTESRAVDRFFADKNVKLQVVPYARTPTTYLIKENFAL